MILKFIKLGIKKFLNIICERIVIKELDIVNENKNSPLRINKLVLEAEDVIYKKLYISRLKITIRNLILRIKLNKILYFENCNANLILILSSKDLLYIILNKKGLRFKSKIEHYLNKKIISINIKNKLIYLYCIDNNKIKYKYPFSLKLKENNIILKYNQDNIFIFSLDKNIIFNKLIFFDKYIKVFFSTKILFND